MCNILNSTLDILPDLF